MRHLWLVSSLFCYYAQGSVDHFVNLSDVAPSIIISPRYCSAENFMGVPVDGYKAPTILLTRQAARALAEVQKRVEKDGYNLVVYDGYRPQKAVDHFLRWSEDVADQKKKAQYYPTINKADVFGLGYVVTRSGHTRGSTVDLTLIERGKSVHAVTEEKRTLADGAQILFLDDGTLDMGSSFDLFHEVSHCQSKLISPACKKRRQYLRRVMEGCGFGGVSSEWWHFTLKDEPFTKQASKSYFNFDVK